MKSTTVLVVEDEPVLLHLTGENLRTRGYVVCEAATAVRAAEELRKTMVDVAFVDVNLPGLMNGLTFAVWLREQYPKIPVILTSGVRSSLPSNLKGLGGVPLMQKPYEMDELIQLIQEALG